MASIKAVASGYVAELDIPTKQQLKDAWQYQAMLEIAGERFQELARSDTDVGLASIAALQAAIKAAKSAALPTLQITEE